MKKILFIPFMLMSVLGMQIVGWTQADDRNRLAYNHPGLVVDLGVGLWAIPLPMDWDGDGDMDLVISSSGAPYRGVYFFENDGSGVFLPAQRIDDGKSNVTISYIGEEFWVATPGTVYKDFVPNAYANPLSIDYEQEFHAGRFNQWKFADYDGDDVLDLYVGASDERDYGWDDAYDSQGRWQNGPLRGFVYWVKNQGTNENPKYGRAEQLLAAGKPLEVYGAPSPNLVDWDGDGDLDLICGEFLDRITFFENIGTRKEPLYAAGRFLEVDGEVLHLELEMLQVVVVDFDQDGDPDIVVGKEDGRVVFLENTGRDDSGYPVLKPPVYFRQRADKVKCGALVTPSSVDWDGDGDEDLICGNTAGFLEFIENLGGYPPKWAEPKRLTAEGEVIRIMAGENLSIQGPCEAKWGYTVPVVADWNHDGLPDIVVNSIIGRIKWFRNIGTRTEPRLAKAEPILVQWEQAPPKPAWNWWNPAAGELVVQWRTTPVVVDLNEDGLNDLVLQDHEGFLAFYERQKVDGELLLKTGQRIFFSGEENPLILNHNNELTVIDLNEDGVNDLTLVEKDGSPLYFYTRPGIRDQYLRSALRTLDAQAVAELSSTTETETLLRVNAGWAGRSGRRKFTLVDWNQDGKMDILINSRNMDFLENVGDEGRLAFCRRGEMVDDRLAGHTTCPTIVDWNQDGISDLLVGAEDGFLYYYPRKTSQDLLGKTVR